MQNSLLIKADNLSYKINESKLFSGISFALNSNQALHIMGSNGSGKSTLIRILGGISEPSKGNVTKKENLTISYLGHKNALKSYLSVRDNLDLLDLWDNDQIDNLLSKFDLMNKLDGAGIGLRHAHFHSRLSVGTFVPRLSEQECGFKHSL